MQPSFLAPGSPANAVEMWEKPALHAQNTLLAIPQLQSIHTPLYAPGLASLLPERLSTTTVVPHLALPLASSTSLSSTTTPTDTKNQGYSASVVFGYP